MLDPTVTERIRSIFLHYEAPVTIEMAARLLGRSGGEIAAAIEDGEIETTPGCGGPMIDIRELAEQAVHVWPIDAIKEALGREAALILPAGFGRAGSRRGCRATSWRRSSAWPRRMARAPTRC
jgi:hypothetical protein